MDMKALGNHWRDSEMFILEKTEGTHDHYLPVPKGLSSRRIIRQVFLGVRVQICVQWIEVSER